MSGVDITQGSIVAVDPDELREVATRVENASYHASSAKAEVSAADALQRDNPIPELSYVWPCGTGIYVECERVYDESRALSEGLRLAADTYEMVELRTLIAMREGDVPTHIRRMKSLYLRLPEPMKLSEHLWTAWEELTGSQLSDSWGHTSAHAGLVMSVFIHQLVKVRTDYGMGRGSLGEPRRAEARKPTTPGTSDRVVPMAKTPLGTNKAPASLADSVRRTPSGESDDLSDRARVRIEKYRMADGSERFVAYLSGSREMPWTNEDPFSWQNNVGLYVGLPNSEGYNFVLEALERAGAEAGSVVDVTAFSQGGMLAQRLATDSDFDVQHVTTLGSPLRIPMGDDVTSLTLAHDDDPVAALSDGGSPMSLGDDDSLLVTRTFDDTATTLERWSANAHRVSAYADTARLFEESGDIRGGAVSDYFDELSRATLLESFAYEVPEDPIGRVIGGSSSSGDEG